MEDNLLDYQQEPVSSKSIAIKYGLILGVVNIIFTLIILYTGLLGNTIIGFLGYGIYFAFLFLGMKEFKGDNNGVMTFGKGFGLGTLASLIAGLFMCVFFYVYLSFIDDYLLTFMLDFTVTQLEESGTVDQNAIDMAMSIYEDYLFTPLGYSILALVSGFFVGMIISLITAAITKKNPEVPY
ncbi:DUF4199 domain-containing protein [Flammeovirgaceae bacterium SG7u.111]|nr:DUF4199 domain-containing protein [Flammeovirgaceae bacterium SG7u.132]WPO34740.1 DUF4199 domain-containing protein [Flammeovirgaceae bacterium SG7u.111]